MAVSISVGSHAVAFPDGATPLGIRAMAFMAISPSSVVEGASVTKHGASCVLISTRAISGAFSPGRSHVSPVRRISSVLAVISLGTAQEICRLGRP